MHLRLADDRIWPLDAPRLMGILNITTDSFSDGGLYLEPSAAVTQGLRLAQAGADILDLGAQSTRPGAAPIPADTQIARLVPVIQELRTQLRACGSAALLSVDTDEPAVARAALAAGTDLINDVRGGSAPGMLELAAEQRVPIVLMHMQGTPATMQLDPRYDDVVREVREYLLARAQAAQAAGVTRDRIVIDPGIGFGKTLAHNVALLRHLGELVATGYPVLVGASRKRFLGALVAEATGKTPGPAELDAATCAVTAYAVAQGARLLRVHDVAGNRQALAVARALWE